MTIIVTIIELGVALTYPRRDHDLYKFLSTLPEVASTQVSDSLVNWFLGKRFLIILHLKEGVTIHLNKLDSSTPENVV